MDIPRLFRREGTKLGAFFFGLYWPVAEPGIKKVAAAKKARAAGKREQRWEGQKKGTTAAAPPEPSYATGTG